mmetsp:Transcript_151459/g.367838  ORF Transcript_151459/g.367838 Transcript_151459/m.367838 type:complete len:217 (+) Transcript_151459:870-1520(+)
MPEALPDCSLSAWEKLPPTPRKPTLPCTVTELLWPLPSSDLQAVDAELSSSNAVISSSAQASPRMASMPPRCTGPRMMWEPYSLKKSFVSPLSSALIGARSSLCTAAWPRCCLQVQIRLRRSAASGVRRIRGASGKVMRYLESALKRVWVRLWNFTVARTPALSCDSDPAPAVLLPALPSLELKPPPPNMEWNSAALEELEANVLAKAAEKPNVST